MLAKVQANDLSETAQRHVDADCAWLGRRSPENPDSGRGAQGHGRVVQISTRIHEKIERLARKAQWRREFIIRDPSIFEVLYCGTFSSTVTTFLRGRSTLHAPQQTATFVPYRMAVEYHILL